MTGEELGSLRKPGDSVITKEGHTVQLVEDGGGRLLFLSQIPSSTPPTSYQKPSPESSNSVRCPLQKKSGKRVSKLASIDPSNIIAMTDTEEEGSRRGTPPTSAMPPSYSLRNRRAPQGKLIYDAKYHPMDDSIRPSQAAKRRSAHGEIILSSDDETETETFTVHSDSEAEGEADNEDLIKKFRPSKNKKRSRSRSESLLPTRRSSRRITKQKILYNMDVHPQDRYLEVSSSSDDDPEVSSHDVKRKKASRLIKNTPVHEQKYQAKFINTTIADSEVEDENNINSEEPTRDNVSDGRSDEDTIQVQVRDLPLTSSSPVPNVSTTPAFGARHAEELEACLMKPGERSLLHGRDPWPIKQGLPFKIHTECLEDQLAAEADAASPFNLDDDDKENNVIDVRYGNTLDPTEGVSVIPVSQYRSSREGSESFNHLAASAAFYDTTYHGSHLAYNLGGSDGSHDQDVVIDKAKPKAAATRLRTSTDRRPSTTIVQEQQKEVDQALRDTSSGSVDGGSLMRELRTFTPINRRS
ncbi:hypothetical protein DE146DRAFT_99546 [Phaeosphaeria sp. MPI-PUGE-AT-0046c]|nr:hypothetical protein DE146DRAFT_99546 [Phaeosphaeria sp. MPI-PUGE-AT-0046c]